MAEPSLIATEEPSLLQEEFLGTGSDTQDRDVAMSMTIMDAAEQGGLGAEAAIDQNLGRIQSMTREEIVADIFDKSKAYSDAEIGAVETVISEASQSQDQETLKAINQFGAAYITEVLGQEDVNDPRDIQALAIRAIADTDDKRLQQVIADQYLGSVGREFYEKIGWNWSTAGDLVAYIAPDTLFDDAQLRDQFEKMGLPAGTTISEFVDWFEGLSPTEQVKFGRSYADALTATGDSNYLKMASRWNQLIEADVFMGHVEVAEDVFDVVTLGGWQLAKHLWRAATTQNAVRAAKEAGRAEVAGEINAAAMTSERVATAAQTDRITAAQNSLPFEYEPISPGSVDGISSETLTVVEEAKRRIGEQLAKIDLPEYRVKGNLMSEQGRVAFERRLRDEKDAIAERLNIQADHVKSLSLAELTDTKATLKVEWNARDSRGRFTGRKGETDVTLDFTYDDLGNLDMVTVRGQEGKRVGYFETLLTSPAVTQNRIFGEEIVERVTLAEQQTARMLEGFTPILRQTWGKLNTEGKDRVSAVLQAGDEYSESGRRVTRTYNLRELTIDGVETKQGLMRLTPEEAAAYVNSRQILDVQWDLANSIARKDYQLQGYNQSIKINLPGEAGARVGTDIPVKEVAGTGPAKSVMIASSGKVISVGGKRYQELLEKGARLYRSKETIEVAPGKYVGLYIGEPTELMPLPSRILRYYPGYLPGEFVSNWRFVRVPRAHTVNGVAKGNEYITIGRASSEKEARAWLQTEEAQNLIASHGVSVDDVVVEGEKAFRQVEGQVDDWEKFGGTIFSPRASHEVVDITGEGRVGAPEAISNAIRAVSNIVPMQEIRSKMQSTWLKSAAPYLKPGTGTSFRRAELADTLPVGSPERTALESSKRYIDWLSRIPTEGEQRLRNFGESVGLWLEKYAVFDKGAGKRFRMAFQNFGGAHPADSLRASAFHGLLGFYNPAQIAVQASQAAVVLALNPLNGPKYIRNGLALRMAMFQMEHPENIKRIAKAFGISDADEFAAMVRGFDRLGIRQNIVSHADYSNALQGYALDGNILRRAVENGLVFFKEGELVNRSWGFFRAGDEFLKANPTKKWSTLTDEDLAKINDRMLKLTFNLSRSNAAEFQKGWTSIPTQFLQIMTKSMENLFPWMFPGASKNKQLSALDRNRIITGQLMLFGAAGIPGGAYLSRNTIPALFGNDVYDGLDDETLAAFDQGISGALTEWAFGVQPEISGRTALLSPIVETLDRIFTDEATLPEQVFAASGAIPGRAMDAMKVLAPLFRASLSDSEKFSMTARDYSIALSEVAGVISTFRNVSKAYWINRNGIVTSNTGTVLYRIDEDEQTATSIIKLLGFQTREETLQYQTKELLQGASADRKKAADAILILAQRYLNNRITDPFNENEYAKFVFMTESILKALPVQGDRDKVMESVKRRYKSAEYDKLIKEVFDRATEGDREFLYLRERLDG